MVIRAASLIYTSTKNTREWLALAVGVVALSSGPGTEREEKYVISPGAF